MNMKKIVPTILLTVLPFTIPFSSVFAHVSVKPSEVGVGSRQTFVTGVPNEKDIPTTGVRLVIPAGIKSVTPFVKPGWTIEIVKEGEGEDAVAKEIIWSGGSIPVGLRDEFAFSTQAPTEETELQWKAYQTYQDGTIVSWDQDPNIEEDSEGGTSGPYSVTKVVNDITKTVQEDTSQQSLPMILSVLALILSVVAIFVAKNK